MVQSVLNRVIVSVSPILLLAFLGAFVTRPGVLSSPSDHTLKSAIGGCDLPSASCSLSDACVSESGNWFYYHYSHLGSGATSAGTIECFRKVQWQLPNCKGASSLFGQWFICT